VGLFTNPHKHRKLRKNVLSKFPQVRPGRIYGHLDKGTLMDERLLAELRRIVSSKPDVTAMIEFHSRHRARRQIDIAVLSPGGVDVIELKQHSRHVTGGPGETWFAGDRPMGNQRTEQGRSVIENPMQQATNSADDLSAWLALAISELTGCPLHDAIGSLKGGVRPLVWLPNVRSADIISSSHCWYHVGLTGLAPKLRCLKNGVTDDATPWTPDAYLRLPSMLGMEALDLMRVQGEVLDARTAKPVRRVAVSLGSLDRQVETNQQGVFEFSAAPGRPLTLRLVPLSAHHPRDAELQLPDGRAWRIPAADLMLTPTAAPDAEQTVALLQLQERVEALTSETARVSEEAEAAHALRAAERIRAEEEIQAAERLVDEAGNDLERARQATRDLEVLRERFEEERRLREQAQEDARTNQVLIQQALESATRAQHDIDHAASQGQDAFDQALAEARSSMTRQQEEHARELKAMRQRIDEAAARQAQQRETLLRENEELRAGLERERLQQHGETQDRQIVQQRLQQESETARTRAQEMEAQLRLREQQLKAQGEMIEQLQRAQKERENLAPQGTQDKDGTHQQSPEVPRRVKHMARVRILQRGGPTGNVTPPSGLASAAIPKETAPPVSQEWREEWQARVKNLTLEELICDLGQAEHLLSLTSPGPIRTQLLERLCCLNRVGVG
jgi:hypothetical protein